MEPVDLESLPEDALLMVDSAPIIYMLEGHPAFMPRFRPLFDAHAAGRLRFAVTTLAIAEVLTGPLKAGDEALARRFEEGRQNGLIDDAAGAQLAVDHIETQVLQRFSGNVRPHGSCPR